MRRLDRTVNPNSTSTADFEVGGEFEQDLAFSGCLASCTLGCLTPFVVGGLAITLGVYDFDPWAFGIWGVLTVAGVIAAYAVSRPDHEVARLRVDRSTRTLEWWEWTGRRTQRRRWIPIEDIEAMELHAEEYSLDFRLQVEVTLHTKGRPPGEDREEVGLIGALTGAQYRPLPDDDEARREVEANRVDLDLTLDWETTQTIAGFGADLARVLELPFHHQLAPESPSTGEEAETDGAAARSARKAPTHRFDGDPSGTGIDSIPAPAVDPSRWAPIPAEPKPPGDSKERSKKDQRALREFRLHRERIHIGEIGAVGWLRLLAIFAFFAIASPVPWLFEHVGTTVTSLGVAAALVVVVGGLVGSLAPEAVRRVEIDRPSRTIEVRSLGRRVELAFADIERVVLVTVLKDPPESDPATEASTPPDAPKLEIGPTARGVVDESRLVFDTPRGSIILPREIDHLKLEQQLTLALELGTIVSAPALHFTRPSVADFLESTA